MKKIKHFLKWQRDNTGGFSLLMHITNLLAVGIAILIFGMSDLLGAVLLFASIYFFFEGISLVSAYVNRDRPKIEVDYRGVKMDDEGISSIERHLSNERRNNI